MNSIIHDSNGIHTNQNTSQKQKYRNILKWLGFLEVSLGSICFIVGAFAVAYYDDSSSSYFTNRSYGYPFYYRREVTIGEGIWCGVWIIVAGGLGIAAGKKSSTLCLINTHLVFSIIGTLFAALLVALSGVWARKSYSNVYFRGILLSLGIFAFVAMILQIVSVVYCCVTKKGCCHGCSDDPYVAAPVEVRYIAVPAQITGQNLTGVSQMQLYQINSSPDAQQPLLVPQQSMMDKDQQNSEKNSTAEN